MAYVTTTYEAPYEPVYSERLFTVSQSLPSDTLSSSVLFPMTGS